LAAIVGVVLNIVLKEEKHESESKDVEVNKDTIAS